MVLSNPCLFAFKHYGSGLSFPLHLHGPHIKITQNLQTKHQCIPCGGIDTSRRHFINSLVVFSGAQSAQIPSENKDERNLLQTMGSIGLCTTASKLLGFLREALIAAVFGVGPVITAFNYSLILPSFFMAILGGLNGPVQVTTMASLRKLDREEAEILIGKLLTIITLGCGILSVALFAFSCPIIDSMAPGLLISASDHVTRSLAVLQLKIMAPCALLAGLIGLGFGSLSSRGVYGALSLSPSITSVSVIFMVLLHTVVAGLYRKPSTRLISGAASLALGFTLGATGQCIFQVKMHHDVGVPFLSFQSVNPFKDKNIQEVVMVLVPAIVGSSMLQVATFTDLYFASFIPGAAAGLGYANLLVMAPIGILSSSILFSMSSVIAKLAEPSNWSELKFRVGETFLLLLAVTLLMTAVMFPLSRPIVEVSLQRLAFDASASTLVSSLIRYYVVGSTAYLMRELLVQLFYTLGDGQTPCLISTMAIITNALLDWFFLRVVKLGAEGLVLATTTVHVVSDITMLMLLSRKLHGLPLKTWAKSSLKMIFASTISAIFTHFSYKFSYCAFGSLRHLWAIKSFSILLATIFGVTVFLSILGIFGKTELELLQKLFHQKLNKEMKF